MNFIYLVVVSLDIGDIKMIRYKEEQSTPQALCDGMEDMDIEDSYQNESKGDPNNEFKNITK